MAYRAVTKTRIGIETRIHLVRGMRVMLSADLAELYGVAPKALIQAVQRNRARFPADFMFQISAEEDEILKSQFVTSRWGGARRARPYAFAEQGVAMLSGVLRSARAVAVNVEIMRAFVRLQRVAGSLAALARRMAELERKHDARFGEVFQAIRELIASPAPEPKRIGFKTESSLARAARRAPPRLRAVS